MGKKLRIFAAIAIPLSILTPTGVAVGFGLENNHLQENHQVEIVEKGNQIDALKALQKELEEGISARDTRIVEVENDKAQIQVKFDNATIALAKANGDLAKEKENVAKLEGDVTQLETRIVTYEKRIATLEISSTEYLTQIENLKRAKQQAENERDSTQQELNQSQVALQEKITALANVEAEKETIKAERDGLQTQLTEKQQELSAKTTEVENLTNTITSLNSDISNLETRISELDSEAEDYQEQLASLQAQKTAKEEELATTQANLASAQGEVETLTNRVSELETNISNLNTRISTLESEKETLTTERDALQTQLAEKQQKLDEANAKITTLETQIEALETSNAEYVNQIASLQQEKQEITTERDNAQQALTVAQNNIATLNSTISTLENDKAQLQADIEELNTQISTLNSEKAQLQQEKSNLQTSLTYYMGNYTPASSEDFAVATYYVNNELYSAQLLKKGSYSYVADPNVENYQGWLVNGQAVTISAYPINQNVRFDADIYVKTLNDYSWNEISNISQSGKASEHFNVGDKKDITLSTGEAVTLIIMGFNRDDLSDGTGKAGITFGMENSLATTYKMNSSNTNTGGWDTSLMRTETMTTLLSQLPADLQKVIKFVNKKASAGNKSTTITTSSDKLWLFSEVEIDNTTTATYADEGVQYEYWKTIKDGTVAGDRIKRRNGYLVDWWLRSPSLVDATPFRYVSVGGKVGNNSVINAYGVSFGFCV